MNTAVEEPILTTKQRDRIAEFLKTIRLGLDMGEKAGGIAVVQGNRILHAETFVDFHDVTIEKRRQLRRNRRTRHAHKMRLARLRSWAMRQKLDDGQRLPDPYKVMREESLHPVAKECLAASRAGAATPQQFVKALTLVFQKRGFKWEGNESLQAMSLKDLKAFLKQARVPREEQRRFEDEFQRRTAVPDDEGKILSAKDKPELQALLNESLNRTPQPRVAEHRMFHEAELHAVIEGFAQRHAPKQVAAWTKQLNALLNKAVRLARFDNRIVSGCSWCGMQTPRRGKETVRKNNFLAAVCNLRIQTGARARPLTETERRPFLDLWDSRSTIPDFATARDKVREIIRGLDLAINAATLGSILGDIKPRKMQRLLNKTSEARRTIGDQLLDILKGPAKGRAKLCARCSTFAAQGKTKREAGVEWQALAKMKSKNPCRKQRDERIIRRLERLLFKENSWGKQIAFLTLEMPEPRTLRPAKGQKAQRQPQHIKERLLKETDDECFYQVHPSCPKKLSRETCQIEHIFPDSRGGPNAQENLAVACAACNKEKDKRTPWEWLGKGRSQWESFEKRVIGLNCGPRKKVLLLYQQSEYPDDPSPLARVSARAHEFIADLMEMFKRNGCEPPRLSYTPEAAHIQTADGRWTAYLRRSWRAYPSGEENFTVKSSADLLNHAQDAALLAATPPHTWRSQIRCETIPIDGKPIPGLALRSMAPRWPDYEEKIKGQSVVRVLGKYKTSWKRQSAREVFVSRKVNPENGKVVFTKRLGLEEIDRKKVGRIFDPRLRAEAQRYFADNPQAKNLPDDFGKKLGEQCKNTVRRIQIIDKDANEDRVAQIKPHDGPMRYLVPQPANECLEAWLCPDGKIGLFVRRNSVLFSDKPYADANTPPSGSRLIRRFQRNEMLHLPQKGKYPAGAYIIRKIEGKATLVLVPEHLLTGYGSDSASNAEEQDDKNLQRSFGKNAIIVYLKAIGAISGPT